MSSFEPESKRTVIRVSQVGVGISLELGYVGGEICEVSRYVLGGVPVISWPGLRLLAQRGGEPDPKGVIILAIARMV